MYKYMYKMNKTNLTFGTKKGLNCFRSYATKMWNALPTVIKTCKSLVSFKNTLKGQLWVPAILNWPL